MELKDRLIKEVADRMDLKEEVVEKIINFQFKDGNDNTRNSKEIEFSGLGKFVMSIPKVRKKLAFYEAYLLTLSEDDKLYKSKLENTNNYIEYLKSKL